ncbi:MAG: S4 domain-containing protein [Candidatus Cloacimonadaceae bacterium]|jgi:ribosomal 50S subunit-recycling heat shock protein|nr:RNA-binding protein [Candidatus Cloacimonadota bacterium]MDY0127885.1 S4 domain-containing protein [Candidatus Cloacimonadaceae bacterium]MCB5255106.1 RNA-binding protein [Candidatus Cloacimonadota bacterium]MCK9178466.1 S4 domain-containing protein [Candidatus Cloacimonadota bacterium]MCK9242048.1 S4 domain-containing protein [Candidatus Cloacimonadota bacterium]
MRLDILLNKLCFTKTRSIAKNACDKGLVSVNGKIAKAAQIVQKDDIIVLRLYGYAHEIKLSSIPTGNVAKKDAGSYYEMLSREPLS